MEALAKEDEGVSGIEAATCPTDPSCLRVRESRPRGGFDILDRLSGAGDAAVAMCGDVAAPGLMNSGETGRLMGLTGLTGSGVTLRSLCVDVDADGIAGAGVCIEGGA